MKTVTFDPSAYKLVPVSETPEWRTNLTEIGYSHKTIIKDVLQSVPDQLPGVVVHSGEPVAWADALKISDLPEVDEALHNFSHDSTEDNAVCVVLKVLQANPAPSQLDPFEAVYCQLKGCEPHGLASCDGFKEWKDWLSVPSTPSRHYEEQPDGSVIPVDPDDRQPNASQPSAEALVQAALEAASAECNRMMMFPGGRQESYAHHGVDAAAEAIRALSAQQIIESCKEKS